MENRDWMYTGYPSMTPEWMQKTNDFVEHAFGEFAQGRIKMPCPCVKCDNHTRKSKVAVGKDLCKYGFTPNYTVWIHHGEAYRIREEVVRPCLEAFDGDAGVADWMDDFHEAQFGEGFENEPEESAKAYYERI